MIVFVSYARRDNKPSELRAIERAVAHIGTPYIDDVHGYDTPDRRGAVELALENAMVFVGVATPGYLATPWTKREFAVAVRRRIPMLALLCSGHLVDQSDPEWPWGSERLLCG